MNISYSKFKRIFGNVNIVEWVKFNWLASNYYYNIVKKVEEEGYSIDGYINNELYNHITSSINIWNEETQLGYWNAENGQFVPTTNQLCSKNKTYLFGNTQYYLLTPSTNCIIRVLYYDANDNFILQINNVNGVFTTPVNCAYIQFNIEGGYGTTYNHDICINESNPYINGNYFPYFEGEKFLVMVGRVDLGTLSWVYNSSYAYFYANLPTDTIYRLTPNLLSSLYNAIEPTYTTQFANVSDKSITFNRDGNPNVGSITRLICIKNTSYTNTTTFKTAMSGVPLDYELATPILIDI